MIEPGDPDENRRGVPFGFSRVLVEEEQAAIALGQRYLDEWKRLNEPPSNGWIEHGEALSCDG